MIWEGGKRGNHFPWSNYNPDPGLLLFTKIYKIQKSTFLEENSLKLYRKYRKILDPLLSILIFLDNKIIFMKMVKYKITE